MAPMRKSRKPLNRKPEQLAELSIPNHFRCPISLDLMADPVTVPTGITYDRRSIETWLLEMGNSNCPVTNQHLDVVAGADDLLIPNHSLRRMIQDWCVANRAHGVERIPTPKIPITSAQAHDLLSELQSSPSRARELAATVRRLAAESERNRKCLGAAGAALSLAAEFSRASGARDEILRAIAVFLPLDAAAAGRLGSAEAISSIVAVLHSGELAALAVLKDVVSINGETARVASEADGLIEALVELVKNPASPRAMNTAIMAAYRLVSLGEEKVVKNFVELGMVSLLVEALVDSEKTTCEKALAVLDKVMDFEKGREAARGHALAVPVLVKKMFRVSDIATGFVVSALWKLCKSEERVVVEAARVGAFQKVLLLLQVGCTESTKEKATELLKMMNGRRESLDCVDALDFKGLKRSL